MKKAFEAMQQNVENTPQVQRNQPLAAKDAMSPELAEGQSHMQVTWDVHGHASAGEEYMGSLATDTAEGKDACDLSLGHEGDERNTEPCIYDGEIGSEPLFDLSPRSVYQGFVMSEILQRPTIGRRIRRQGGNDGRFARINRR